MSTPLNTDIALLEGLATGSREAVAEIYRLYRPMLVKWITTRGGTETDADDIFQESLMVMFEKAKLPEFCLTCKLSTYLFAVSKRLWFKKIEYNSGYTGFNDPEEEETGHVYEDDLLQHWEKERQLTQLWHSMDKLGAPCSQLLKAFYMENRSMQEIAAAFNYTNAENAKTQKYKCLTRLKKIFFQTRTVTSTE